jgi:glycosyl transferase, family 25
MAGGASALKQVLYINLDRDEHRRRLIHAELDRIGLTATRVPAVERLAVPADLAGYFAHVVQKRAPLIEPGAIGCYASHLRAYKKIIAEQAAATLVLEDDAVLDDDLAEVIRHTLAMLPADWDMVHLGQLSRYAVKPLAALPNGRALVRYSRIPSGTAGYLISLAGAKKMLDPEISRFWAIDLDTRRSWVFGLDVYGVVAPPIRPNKSLPSTIGYDIKLRVRRGLPRPTAYSWTNTPLHTPRGLVFNVRKLGPIWWLRCFAINCAVKLRGALVPMARQLAPPVQAHANHSQS